MSTNNRRSSGRSSGNRSSRKAAAPAAATSAPAPAAQSTDDFDDDEAEGACNSVLCVVVGALVLAAAVTGVVIACCCCKTAETEAAGATTTEGGSGASAPAPPAPPAGGSGAKAKGTQYSRQFANEMTELLKKDMNDLNVKKMSLAFDELKLNSKWGTTETLSADAKKALTTCVVEIDAAVRQVFGPNADSQALDTRDEWNNSKNAAGEGAGKIRDDIFERAVVRLAARHNELVKGHPAKAVSHQEICAAVEKNAPGALDKCYALNGGAWREVEEAPVAVPKNPAGTDQGREAQLTRNKVAAKGGKESFLQM